MLGSTVRSTATFFLLLCALALGATTACYETPEPDCAFLCGREDSACPDGYSCNSEGFCLRDDAPADTSCGTAAVTDAAPPQDTTAPDADPGDAAPPDAAAGDAAPPDAGLTTRSSEPR
ncbi:MAG: hypothetical protein AAGC55_04220 [Myxococcota bacterium]